jgi:hypothetical protein
MRRGYSGSGAPGAVPCLAVVSGGVAGSDFMQISSREAEANRPFIQGAKRLGPPQNTE